MIVADHTALTAAVLQVMEKTADPRLREILVALARHLHAFVREVRLTEDEFRAATALLVKIGQQTTDSHNEMVLMAGSLGVSQLVCLLNNTSAAAPETTQNLLGPFWRMHTPRMRNGESIVRSPTPGATLFVRGRVEDRQGMPIAGAEVDIWHSSPEGRYENEDPKQASMNLRGQFVTDDAGRFWLRSVRPAGYPVPTTGVVGDLLRAQGRHPFRPAHMHALIAKSGYKTLISQVYDASDPRIESDVQFGVTKAVIGNYIRHDEPHPSEKDAGTPWYQLDYTFVMDAGESRLPRPPIK
jgi:catechol 1,2-dioxygenase